MIRRIALTLIGLTTVLLIAGTVPLGLSMTARERLAYVDSARAAARLIASAAEEHLSDGLPADAMRHELAEAQRNGDCAGVFDNLGRLVARTPCPISAEEDQRELVTKTLAGEEPEPPEESGRLLERFPRWARAYQSDGGAGRLTDDAVAVLCDFGLARHSGGADGSVQLLPAALRYTVDRKET